MPEKFTPCNGKKILFCMGQHPHFMQLAVCKTEAECKRIDSQWKRGYKGLCVYQYGGKGKRKGTILFLKKHMTIGCIAHEAYHAAYNFTLDMVMPALKHMPDQEMSAYAEECIARIVENIVNQIIES